MSRQPLKMAKLLQNFFCKPKTDNRANSNIFQNTYHKYNLSSAKKRPLSTNVYTQTADYLGLQPRVIFEMEAENTSITKSTIKMVFMITYHKVVMQNQLYSYNFSFFLSSLLLLFLLVCSYSCLLFWGGRLSVKGYAAYSPLSFTTADKRQMYRRYHKN